MKRALAFAAAVLAGAPCAAMTIAEAAVAQTAAPPPAAATPATAAPPATAPPAAPQAAAAPSIALEQARKVLAAAEAEAKRLNLPATIVVVEPGGDIVVASKMDNAPYGGFDSARRKARAAALAKRPTGQPAASPAAPIVVPTAGAATGGEPILAAGKVIGAVGVSAGKLQEEQVAKAAAAALR